MNRGRAAHQHLNFEMRNLAKKQVPLRIRGLGIMNFAMWIKNELNHSQMGSDLKASKCLPAGQALTETLSMRATENWD